MKTFITVALCLFLLSVPGAQAVAEDSSLSAAQAHEEVRLVVEQLLRYHPDPFHQISRKDFYGEVEALLEEKGDVSVAELAAILLDVSTLALISDKPLTARLMPIPGKTAGDATGFDFPYLTNGCVLAARGHGAQRVFAGSDFAVL